MSFEPQLWAFPWIERVASASNPADAPSRGDREACREFGAVFRPEAPAVAIGRGRVDPVEYVDGKGKGGSEPVVHIGQAVGLCRRRCEKHKDDALVLDKWFRTQASTAEGPEVLDDPDLADSEPLSPATWREAEDEVRAGVATLAEHGFDTTPSGGAGLAALLAGLELGAGARVLAVLSEGPEDG